MNYDSTELGKGWLCSPRDPASHCPCLLVDADPRLMGLYTQCWSKRLPLHSEHQPRFMRTRASLL